MFTPNLSFWKKIARNSLYFVLFWLSIYLAIFTFNMAKEPKIVVEEKVMYKDRFIEGVATEIDELHQGQPVQWFGYQMCVSSIMILNIKKGTLEDEPPVTINLRPYGQC